MDLLNTIFKPIIHFIILISIFFLLGLIYNVNKFNSFTKNIFEISLNDKLMSCYYTEIYNNAFLMNGTNEGYNNVKPFTNKINLNNKIILNVNEFEVYHTNDIREMNNTGWSREQNLIYKKTSNNKLTLQIKRKDKILYEGQFISDISDYINENGRYYFHIYSTRKDNLISSVKTHISFNVIVE